MTQENKQLLLKDLCCRLPYGVKVQHQQPDYLDEIQTIEYIKREYGEIETESVLGFVDDFKPYLRPMSSMTDEEESEYNLIQGLSHLDQHWTANDGKIYRYADAIDWLNSKHFDYRGLIEKNLALDCTGLHIYD